MELGQVAAAFGRRALPPTLAIHSPATAPARAEQIMKACCCAPRIGSFVGLSCALVFSLGLGFFFWSGGSDNFKCLFSVCKN